MTYQTHTALLIDAENTPLGQLTTFLEKWRPYDRSITLKRAYGNWSNPCLKNWEPLLRTHAVRPVQLFDCAAGKNAADIALAVDAMELLQTGRYDTFILMASDSDYTPLALKLREAGVRVMGIGKDDVSEAYRSACTHFVYLHNIYAEDPESLQALQNAFSFDEEDDGLEEIGTDAPDLSFLSEEDPADGEDPFRGLEALPDPEDVKDPADEEIVWRTLEDLLEEEFPAGEADSPEEAWSGLEEDLPWESLPTTDESGDVSWDTLTNDLVLREEPAGMDSVHKLLRVACDACRREDGFALLSAAGNFMKEIRPELNYRDYGYAQLHELLLAYSDRYQLIRLPNRAMAFRCRT